MNRIETLISRLGLEPHVEGGFFCRTLKTGDKPFLETENGQRARLSSIYYLLTLDHPVGCFHCNRSDIMHYFHEGDALEYHLIHPDGRYEQKQLGNDLENGQQLQLFVPGGVWKATTLISRRHGYGLLSEAVSPGFEYEDMQIGQADVLSQCFPQHEHVIRRFSKP